MPAFSAPALCSWMGSCVLGSFSETPSKQTLILKGVIRGRWHCKGSSFRRAAGGPGSVGMWHSRVAVAEASLQRQACGQAGVVSLLFLVTELPCLTLWPSRRFVSYSVSFTFTFVEVCLMVQDMASLRTCSVNAWGCMSLSLGSVFPKRWLDSVGWWWCWVLLYCWYSVDLFYGLLREGCRCLRL